MIQSVFELGDTSAREVMVPRTEMVWIEVDKTVGTGDVAGRAVRALPDPGDRRERRRHSRRRVSERPCAATQDSQTAAQRAGRGRDAAGRVRARFQTARRPARRDAARPQPHGAAGRRIRRHRRAGHHRGCARGDRRRDRRRIRHRRDRHPSRISATGVYRVSARLPVEDLGELFGIEIEEDEVDTVGGLLGHALGRVPLPGIGGGRRTDLLLRGEGGDDARGRVRVIRCWSPGGIARASRPGEYPHRGGRTRYRDKTDGAGNERS